MKKNYFALFLVGTVITAAALGAQLTVPRVNAQPGATAVAEVRFQAQGSNITGVQFDLEYPAELSASAVIGPSGSTAGKSLSATDIGAGKKRILIAGLNQNSIGDGVLVTLSIVLPSSPASSQYALRITNPGATDKDGKSIPITAISGTLAVGNSAANVETASHLALLRGRCAPVDRGSEMIAPDMVCSWPISSGGNDFPSGRVRHAGFYMAGN